MPRPQTPFSHRLVLNRWLLSLLGVSSFEELAEILRDEELEGLDESNIHRFHHALIEGLSETATLSPDLLLEYDQNIVRHSQRLNERRLIRGWEPIKWKYFQYLALLFTEVYLDRYFRDAGALRSELNEFIEAWNEGRGEADRISEFPTDDDAWSHLNKLSFWMATGSGKTLLMHANILQFRHHLELHGSERGVNRTILLTPNAGLSRQHLYEFEVAGIPAEIFDRNSRDLFSSHAVEILEVTKLRDEMGDTTVAVDAFERNNLVLVDEGHRGTSSGSKGTWMEYRNRLCEDGFSFEYSATFGQAVKGNDELTRDYARNILVDYSYRYFHEDGFGKNYEILNLDETTQKEQLELYLVACLLSVFQQLRLFGEQAVRFRPFQIERPLWVFVGGSVTKTSKAEATDVVEILKFLRRYLDDRSRSVGRIDHVLNRGLVSASQQDLFADRFPYLNTSGLSPGQIFDETLSRLFHAPSGGSLHIENLKGAEGEIALRVGAENPPFGVINVGDDGRLIRMCEKEGLSTGERDFSDSLFHEINGDGSTVNLLIGSRKFTEGWSSWRVSTMGLMNIGRGEGAQIIQLFGRGVRLKGYDLSLKRSARTELPPGIERPKHIDLLETLGIFGVRADYMAQFRDFLIEEGIPTQEDQIELMLPVLRNESANTLKTVRLKRTIKGMRTDTSDAFKMLGPMPTLTSSVPESEHVTESLVVRPIVLNWYPKIQALRASGVGDDDALQSMNEGRLGPRHISVLDFNQLYFELERFKKERGWHNLSITRSALRKLLDEPGWYRLYIPEDELKFESAERLNLWQEIALALLKRYAERFYASRRQAWEGPHLEYGALSEDDPNLLGVGESPSEGYYRISLDRSDEEFLTKLQKLKTAIDEGERPDWAFHGLKTVWFGQHLYEPLLHQDKTTRSVSITPAALNQGEREFVEDLAGFYASSPDQVGDADLYLLRNLSRGRGLGFFEGGSFHPDFILWIVRGDDQHVLFIDPKGLRNYGPDDAKIRFHQTVKEIEDRLGDPAMHLHSFIVSNTYSKELGRLWGQTKEDMVKRNIVFQKDDRGTYISQILTAAGVHTAEAT